MSEIEYSQLAGHITEKLDNTAEYEDWLIIQNYVEELQSNLTKEQLAYINLRDTFNNLQQENQQLKEQNKEIEKECINQRKIFQEKLNKAEHIAQSYKDRYYDEKLKFNKQLKQRDKIVDYAIKVLEKVDYEYDSRATLINVIFDTKHILIKYKGDNNE